MIESIWLKNSSLPRFPALSGDKKTDVLIVGGGLTGLLCAFELKNAGVDYTLIEANRIMRGVSGNTTAKITSQHGLIYDSLLRRFGKERAQMYLRANEAAIEKYRALSKDIDCGFEDKDSFVYSLRNDNPLYKEILALDAIGYKAEYQADLPLPIATLGAVKFKNQAQFDPARFVAAIAQGLNIFEDTKLLELQGLTAVTNRGKIAAKKIIIATHFPLLNKHGSYFLKLYQDRSYVLALKNAQDVKGMHVDENGKGLSFRNYGDLLILGGGSHRTGKRGGNWAELARFSRENYPESTETCRWATQDCMSLDSVPYIGPYSKSTEGIYAATGFNKWGMTSAMVSAEILRDMVLGKTNPYSEVFSPSRSMLRTQLLINGFEATTNLVTFAKKRCPHLGCALKWNAVEHSWDCPCHGSRFDESGELINGPAADDLQKDK